MEIFDTFSLKYQVIHELTGSIKRIKRVSTQTLVLFDVRFLGRPSVTARKGKGICNGFTMVPLGDQEDEEKRYYLDEKGGDGAAGGKRA